MIVTVWEWMERLIANNINNQLKTPWKHHELKWQSAHIIDLQLLWTQTPDK